MWKFWMQHAPVWSPNDEQGGAGEGDNKGEGGDQQGGADEGEGEGEGKAKPGSILDFADKGNDGNGDAEKWAVPDGIEIAPHLIGATAEATVEKLAKAYGSARKAIGSGATLGEVPEKIEGYAFEAKGDDDAIAAELNSEASKPFVDAFREAALKNKVPAELFQSFMRDGMEKVAELGLPLGQSDEEAATASAEAEMAALVETVGQAQANQIVNQVATYGEKLVANGVLLDEADVDEFAQMVGTGRGARIFSRILQAEFGEKPIPAADGLEGNMTQAEAYAAHARALAMPEGAERDQALRAAEESFKKTFSQRPGGQVRSSVL